MNIFIHFIDLKVAINKPHHDECWLLAYIAFWSYLYKKKWNLSDKRNVLMVIKH